MIVQYPDFPPVEGRLSLPRPAVFLLGSYGGANWCIEAARYLEQHVGVVMYGVAPPGYLDSFILWYFHWIERVDIAAVWIGGGPCPGLEWSQFEVGYLFGRHSEVGRPSLVIGIHPALETLRRAMMNISDSLNLELVFHADLPGVLHEVRETARGMR
jgi:hypothetical protein